MNHQEHRLGEAAWALGRLSMAVERSPLRPLWTSHETAHVVARLFSQGVEPVSADQLLALAAGTPDRLPSLTETAARRFWGQAVRLWRPRVALEPMATIPDVTNHLADLVAGDMPPGDLALETPLRLGAATGWALPSTVLALPADEPGEDWSLRFLQGLNQSCREGLERLERLERDYERWLSLLPQRRSDSRLRDAVVLLGTMHALTPRYVGQTLGLTRQASARLLKQLEALTIVRKATKRRRWLIYLAQNAGATPLIPETTTERPSVATLDTETIDRVLDHAYRVLDKTLRSDDAQNTTDKTDAP